MGRCIGVLQVVPETHTEQSHLLFKNFSIECAAENLVVHFAESRLATDQSMAHANLYGTEQASELARALAIKERKEGDFKAVADRVDAVCVQLRARLLAEQEARKKSEVREVDGAEEEEESLEWNGLTPTQEASVQEDAWTLKDRKDEMFAADKAREILFRDPITGAPVRHERETLRELDDYLLELNQPGYPRVPSAQWHWLGNKYLLAQRNVSMTENIKQHITDICKRSTSPRVFLFCVGARHVDFFKTKRTTAPGEAGDGKDLDELLGSRMDVGDDFIAIRYGRLANGNSLFAHEVRALLQLVECFQIPSARFSAGLSNVKKKYKL